MCSKSFLFILACQLVRHDTEAFFLLFCIFHGIFVMLFWRREGEQGITMGGCWGDLLFGWRGSCWRLSHSLEFMYLIIQYLGREIFCCGWHLTKATFSICNIIPSSNIWGTILRLCKSLQKVDFHGTLFQFLSLQSSMSTSLPSIPSVYCISQIWLQILTNEPKPEWNWDSKSSQFAIEPDTQIPSPGQVPFLLNSPFSAQSSRNLWVPLPCSPSSPSSTSSPTSSPPPIVAHIDPPPN